MISKNKAITFGFIAGSLCFGIVLSIVLNRPQQAVAQRGTAPRVLCAMSPLPLAASDATNLQAMGVHYGVAKSASKITCTQAIQTAKAWLGDQLAAEATQMTAQYVAFTSDQYSTVDAQGHRHFPFQNTPAWVVSVEGLTLENHAPPGKAIAYHHEMNIVIDALSGKYLAAFSYR